MNERIKCFDPWRRDVSSRRTEQFLKILTEVVVGGPKQEAAASEAVSVVAINDCYKLRKSTGLLRVLVVVAPMFGILNMCAHTL